MTTWRFGAVLALALAGPAGPALAQASDVVCDKCVGTSDIDIGAVTTGRLSDNAVSAPKLRDGAVTKNKIAPNAVTGDKIASGAVKTGRIADDAVTTPKLRDLAVTAAKLQDGAVTAAKLAPGLLAPSFIVIDDNGAELGPIVDGPWQNNLRVLVEINGEMFTLTVFYNDSSNEDPTDDFYEISRQSQYIYYTTSDNCTTGETYGEPGHFTSPFYFGLYHLGAVDGVAGEGQPRRLWKPTSFTTANVTVMSRKRGSNDDCEDIADAMMSLIPMELVVADLHALFPPPYTVEAR